MLKGISPIISPELIKILMEMGHGDELVIGDGNFPAASMAQRLVRLGWPWGSGDSLTQILRLYPLDSYVDAPVKLMQVTPGDDVVPVIWEKYKAIVEKHAGKVQFEEIERFAFYERAKTAYCVVATGETALYANIILKKGVVVE